MTAANNKLTHRQRIETVLSGQRPDRIPVALWRHFPVDDQNPLLLTRAIAAYQNTFDFDLIKVTPASSFCIRDWGVEDEWCGDEEGTRQFISHPIQRPEDWERLAVLDPKKGYLAAQVESLRELAKTFSPDTPILQTIFNPLAQAKHLIGKDLLLVHLRQYPEAVKHGLDIITQTTIDFVQQVIASGADGLFYAVQHAQYGLLSETEFSEFSRPYDLAILEAANLLWFNMLHLHGQNVMFNLLADYPVQVMNWHDRSTQPNLADGLKRFPGTVCGGLRRIESMILGTPEAIQAEAEDAIDQTDGLRFILGTGCVVPITAPYGNLLAARNAVENQGL
ncbi:MAG TPA: uroporphyrinogen decarboxylase family protein [Longilinea sp.]|nr:uroporphyrinogen decarboxylase family protein [Longilinea sp.]